MEEFDAQEQLAYIRNIMEETRQGLKGGGGDFMQWGILTVIGLIVTYFQAKYGFLGTRIWVVWVVVVGLGWILSIRSYLRARKCRATTRTANIAWRVWGGYGVAASILGFVGPMTGAYSPAYIVAVLAALMGAAYFGTGFLFGSRWLPIFAVGWWCGSVVMFFFPVIQMLLVFSAMMIFFQIIPGYAMYRRQKMNIGTQE